MWAKAEGKSDWPGDDSEFGRVGEGGEAFDMAQKDDGLGIRIKRLRSKHQRPKTPTQQNPLDQPKARLVRGGHAALAERFLSAATRTRCLQALDLESVARGSWSHLPQIRGPLSGQTWFQIDRLVLADQRCVCVSLL